MRVILLEKYRKLGEVGDIVEVRSGYARNFLIPNDKAVQATKLNIHSFEAKKNELVAESKEKEKQAQEEAKKIDNKVAVITKQASDDGRLYGAISTSEVAEQINKNIENKIDRKQITISTSIKYLGIYKSEVDLGEGVTANIYINVARSELEAKELEEKFFKGEVNLGALEKAA